MKVLVTPRSFGKTDASVFNRLQDAGLEIVRNETGSILDEKTLGSLLSGCSGVILGVDPLTKSVIENNPQLKVISRYGVGLDNIDLEACRKREITVTRTLGAIENAVADYTFGLIIGVARRICLVDRHCRENDWGKITSLDVFGKTIGIIGLGAIGKMVAIRARGFEMQILAHDPVWDKEFGDKYAIARTSVDEICKKSDFITLHCSLNESTRYLIDAERLAKMKPTAIVINTARGALVNDMALLKSLQEKTIYGAGLDVFDHEPPTDPAWRNLDNVILGSHCASSTREATEKMGHLAVDNLFRALKINY